VRLKFKTLFQHAPVGTASGTENYSILPWCITFHAESLEHFIQLMDDNSASRQLQEELNVVFQNLRKGIKIVSNLPKESHKPNEAELPELRIRESQNGRGWKGPLWVI